MKNFLILILINFVESSLECSFSTWKTSLEQIVRNQQFSLLNKVGDNTFFPEHLFFGLFCLVRFCFPKKKNGLTPRIMFILLKFTQMFSRSTICQQWFSLPVILPLICHCLWLKKNKHYNIFHMSSKIGNSNTVWHPWDPSGKARTGSDQWYITPFCQ